MAARRAAAAVECVQTERRGRALVALRAIGKDKTILEEKPLLALPLPDSADIALLCELCMAPCAPPAAQLQHAAELDEPPELPLEDEEEYSSVSCRYGCDLHFCSAQCEAAAWSRFHCVLCPA